MGRFKGSTKSRQRHPAYLTGLVSFEFFNNDDEHYRDRSLRELAKAARHEANVSAIPIFPESNPEGGEMAFAAVALDRSAAEQIAKDLMRFLEAKSPGRIIADHWLAEEIPVP